MYVPDFDIDLLRTFVAIAVTGGFARAGERVHRSQSAVSLQMKRLEAQAGVRLFRRDGRRMVLTADGRRLLHYARRILALNDEAKASLDRAGVEGPVRLGTNQDLAETALPDMLARFALTNPAARLEVKVDATATIRAMLADGRIDLALTLGLPDKASTPSETALGRERLIWISDGNVRPAAGTPLPLVLCDEPCGIRAATLTALDAARRPYRIVFTSPSLAGLRAAVRAGLGITVRGERALEPGLAPVAADQSLPPLPELAVTLARAPGAPTPAIDRLAAILEEMFASGGGSAAYPLAPAV
ncbi:MAG: LysR substrate-binding domain-containing protein [Alphaproteobacteria bacterium]|nr:LysR substrate-binding domain-containing protein [Alphaproteobacteria bacterium]